MTAPIEWLRTLTEAQWQQVVVNTATANGWDWYHAPDNRPNARGRVQHVKAGFPDLVLVRDDRLIFAELKRHTGKPTAEQTRWLALLLVAGAETYLWRPSDLPGVERVLSRNYVPEDHR